MSWPSHRPDVAERNYKHGMADRCSEYVIWMGMKARCYTPSTSGYYRYGARGIKVCARWRNSFPNFLTDMGKRPSVLHSIDRKNNNGNYTPSNCRWATKSEQAFNRGSKQ